MAHLPLLRHIRINSGAESEYVETDLKDEFINGQDDPDKNWKVVTPEVALDMGAIGYVFGSRLQRACRSRSASSTTRAAAPRWRAWCRGTSSPTTRMAAEYLAWVDAAARRVQRRGFLAGADGEVASRRGEVAEGDRGGQGEGRRPKKRRRPSKPDGSIRTWSVPGRSPSDAASCYNGMFGVFKGLNIKGVAFHQGFNNAMMNTSCKPKFYRILMKLMVEGWREDFNDPQLPVAVIGLCAGGQAQTRLNFEQQGLSTAAYIREAQRLGLADVGDPEHTAFIPAYDQKIPQLHTKKKKELGLRTARWALKTVYGKEDDRLGHRRAGLRGAGRRQDAADLRPGRCCPTTSDPSSKASRSPTSPASSTWPRPWPSRSRTRTTGTSRSSFPARW